MKLSIKETEALYEILVAFQGPPHYIAELQATRSISKFLSDSNPIELLIAAYNKHANKLRSEI